MRSVILSRWTISLLGVASLAVLLWFFGPFLAPLEAVLPRIVTIALLLLAWAGVNGWLDHRRRGRDAALSAGIAAAEPGPSASDEEVAAVREKLGRALALLRKARGKRGWLYEQPWYVMIGPPGAGKTTALLNSGLRFPLAGEMGEEAVPGIGGTRLCDWWFTDDAVLIDTAGRYTTQDSDAAVDRAGWHAFLDLLKRTRTRQPLNGVLVAISLADLAQGSRDERLAHATAIRRRLKELRERLGVRLPVYALFTKADLIAGFTEFFDDLDRDRRAQVWGATFPLNNDPLGPVAGFGTEFRALVERLDARLLDRMQAERSPDRRAAIAGFPAQVATLQAPLEEFLDIAFTGSRLEPGAMLRGVYFCSGTQEGTPIDRLTGLLANAFGLDQRSTPSLRPEHGRGYFLQRLLRQVVMGEALLVSEPPGSVRRRRMIGAAGAAAVLLGVVLAGGLLWQSSIASHRGIDRMAAAVASYRQAASRLPQGPVSDGNLPAIVPVLDDARALQAQAAPQGGIGLSQSAKLGASARAVYRDALDRLLLPRLIWRLEAQMRAALDQPDFLYQATRIDLMLGGEGPLDRNLVVAWMRLDWERDLSGAGNASLRESLARHLDAMLAEPLPRVALDGALIDEARATFSRASVAQRVYSRIVPSAAAQHLAPWTPAQALGPAGSALFTRSSGRPLTDGIPGLYTADGFRTVLLPSLPRAAAAVAAESWVLGRQSEVAPTIPALAALQHEVMQLYEADSVKQWDAMLADLGLAPSPSVRQEAESLFVLGSPQSPIRVLLAAVVQALDFNPPTTAPATALPAVPRLPGQLSAQAVLLPQDLAARYKPLRDYLAPTGGAAAPIDLALAAINGLQQNLAQLASAAPAASAPAPATDPALTLRAVASQAPQPVQRWLLSLTRSGTSLRAGGARQHAAAALNAAGGPAQLCAEAARGRFPFAPGSAADIPLDDFTRLFAPGGLIDAFFTAELHPYVDTAPRVWKVANTGGAPAPVANADLAPFQRAAQIRQMFFPAGVAAPTLHLDIAPDGLDSGGRQAVLDLGGIGITATRGASAPAQITWPAQGGSIARLVYTPASGPAITLAEASGPWALFRLIAQGRLQQLGPDRFTLVFEQGAHRVTFSLRAASVVNPFASNVLQVFRCPALHA